MKPQPEAELKAAKSPGKPKAKAKTASKAAKTADEAEILVAEADKSDEDKPRRKTNTVPKVPKKK